MYSVYRVLHKKNYFKYLVRIVENITSDIYSVRLVEHTKMTITVH